jgi:hypothetical protein
LGNSKSLEHLCWEHRNLHFIPQPEPHWAESVSSRASSISSAPSLAQTELEPSPPHLHNAKVEDLLRGFAKDPKALAHTLRDFAVRTLLAMTAAARCT